MILYRPTDGDVAMASVAYRPKTCFLMTKLGQPVPDEVEQIRASVTRSFESIGYCVIDANTAVTGRDFLVKIWNMIVSVPVGVAIVDESFPQKTLSNIYYEYGMMQAYGKEVVIVKTAGTDIPSDLVRTEYVRFDASFDTKFGQFCEQLGTQAQYYADFAEQLERNPLLSIDYLRRAFLLSGDERHKERALELFNGAGIADRAKNSVEGLLVGF